MFKRVRTTAAALAFTLAALSRVAAAQSATPVPALDLNRLTGTWFELAHLPNKPEKRCTSNATVLYALADKPHRLQIVDTCLVQDGTTNARNQDARSAHKKGPQTSDGELKIPGFLPYFLAKKYWVLALGPNYEWAIVGSPNHKSLWLLSRTQTPDPALLIELKAKSAAQGFPVAKLVAVPQNP